MDIKEILADAIKKRGVKSLLKREVVKEGRTA